MSIGWSSCSANRFPYNIYTNTYKRFYVCKMSVVFIFIFCLFRVFFVVSNSTECNFTSLFHLNTVNKIHPYTLQSIFLLSIQYLPNCQAMSYVDFVSLFPIYLSAFCCCCCWSLVVVYAPTPTATVVPTWSSCHAIFFAFLYVPWGLILFTAIKSR